MRRKSMSVTSPKFDRCHNSILNDSIPALNVTNDEFVVRFCVADLRILRIQRVNDKRKSDSSKGKKRGRKHKPDHTHDNGVCVFYAPSR